MATAQPSNEGTVQTDRVDPHFRRCVEHYTLPRLAEPPLVTTISNQMVVTRPPQ
jgi:hypothetical protein